MIKLQIDAPIMIATVPIDMRKSIDGLCVAVAEILKRNPQEEQLFLFRNKLGDKIKLLYWDKNGFCLLYKRLEKQRFKFPKGMPGESFAITEKQLSWLLAGFDFAQMNAYPELDFSGYC